MRHIVPAAIRDLLVSIALALLVPATAAAQVTLLPGDILVLDPSGGTTGAVVRVDPATGTQTQVTADNLLTDITAITIAADGRIYVTDCGCAGPPSIIRVHAATGGQVTISSDGFLDTPTGIAVDPASGDLVVVDTGTLTVFRVDPTTGAQTLVSGGGLFSDPRSVAIGPTGDFFVVDTSALAVFRIDPTTGTQTVVSSNQFFATPFAMAAAANGTLYVTDLGDPCACGPPAIIAIDPAGDPSGNQTVVSSCCLLAEPLGIAIAADGTLIVSDGGVFSPPQVVAVDPGTGAQTVISDGTSPGAQLITAAGVAVVPGFTLTVSFSGVGTGTVASDVPGIACPGDCIEIYVAGAVVVLTATPTGGAFFAGWEGACAFAGLDPCTLFMDRDQAVTARFELEPLFPVIVTIGGTGAGTVVGSLPGINCPGDCAESYPFETVLVLTPTAVAGSVFVGWGGACVDAGTGPCSLVVTGSLAVTATFNRVLGILTGAGPGAPPSVRRFTGTGAATATTFDAYASIFSGGVFVAAGDLDGSGGLEIVTGAGMTGGPHVRAFNADGTPRLTSFYAYLATFLGGARVAACDFTGDGRAEIVTGAGPGGAAHVRVILLDALGNPVGDLASFYAYDLAFVGGVWVACGDVDGDGVPDVITGADAGGTPHVRVFSLVGGLHELTGFYAYGTGFTGGVRVAAANVDGSDRASVIVGAGPGGGPHVRVLKWLGGPLVELASFFAFAPDFPGGVFVGAGDVTGDGLADVIVGSGVGGAPTVRVFTGGGADTGVSFAPYGGTFLGGVTVSAGP